MPAPTTAGSHAGPTSAQRGAKFIADPATTEAQVLDFGLFTREVVEAAMARPAKSEALIAELLHTVSGAFGVRADAGTLVDALLTEPALSSANLAAMARLIQCGLVEETSQRLVAVCTHPRCKDYTLVVALWNATPQITSAVALSGGRMVAVAAAWVHRTSAAGTIYPPGGWGVSDRINAVAARWDTWAGDDAGRRHFLLSASFDFTDEAKMFAVGESLTAAPARAPGS